MPSMNDKWEAALVSAGLGDPDALSREQWQWLYARGVAGKGSRATPEEKYEHHLNSVRSHHRVETRERLLAWRRWAVPITHMSKEEFENLPKHYGSIYYPRSAYRAGDSYSPDQWRNWFYNLSPAMQSDYRAKNNERQKGYLRKMTPAQREARRASRRVANPRPSGKPKRVFSLISPGGQEITVVGVKPFAKQYGLLESAVRKLLDRRVPKNRNNPPMSYRGWTLPPQPVIDDGLDQDIIDDGLDKP